MPLYVSSRVRTNLSFAAQVPVSGMTLLLGAIPVASIVPSARVPVPVAFTFHCQDIPGVSWVKSQPARTKVKALRSTDPLADVGLIPSCVKHFDVKFFGKALLLFSIFLQQTRFYLQKRHGAMAQYRR